MCVAFKLKTGNAYNICILLAWTHTRPCGSNSLRRAVVNPKWATVDHSKHVIQKFKSTYMVLSYYLPTYLNWYLDPIVPPPANFREYMPCDIKDMRSMIRWFSANGHRILVIIDSCNELIPEDTMTSSILKYSTHWGRVTHICVSKLTIIGSDNGLSPGRRQAITWTNAGILLIGPLGTTFNETSIEIHIFSFKKIHLKLSSGKRRPFCLGLNVLTMMVPYVVGLRRKDLEIVWGGHSGLWFGGVLNHVCSLKSKSP